MIAFFFCNVFYHLAQSQTLSPSGVNAVSQFRLLGEGSLLVTPAAAPSRRPCGGCFASWPTQLPDPGRPGRLGSWICHAGPACPSLVAVVASAASLRLCGFMPSKHTLCAPRWASGGGG